MIHWYSRLCNDLISEGFFCDTEMDMSIWLTNGNVYLLLLWMEKYFNWILDFYNAEKNEHRTWWASGFMLNLIFILGLMCVFTRLDQMSLWSNSGCKGAVVAFTVRVLCPYMFSVHNAVYKQIVGCKVCMYSCSCLPELWPIALALGVLVN